MVKNKKMPPLLPENRDIKRYIFTRYFIKILITLLWDVFFVAVLFSVAKSGQFEDVPTAVYYILGAIVAVVPYWLMRWDSFLKEKNAVGILVRKGFRYEIELPKGLISKADTKNLANNLDYNSQDGDEGKQVPNFKKDIVYFFIKRPMAKRLKSVIMTTVS